MVKQEKPGTYRMPYLLKCEVGVVGVGHGLLQAAVMRDREVRVDVTDAAVITEICNSREIT